MNHHEPHHFSGILLLLLALLSIYGWVSYPPVRDNRPPVLIVEPARELSVHEDNQKDEEHLKLAIEDINVRP